MASLAYGPFGRLQRSGDEFNLSTSLLQEKARLDREIDNLLKWTLPQGWQQLPLGFENHPSDQLKNGREIFHGNNRVDLFRNAMTASPTVQDGGDNVAGPLPDYTSPRLDLKQLLNILRHYPPVQIFTRSRQILFVLLSIFKQPNPNEEDCATAMEVLSYMNSRFGQIDAEENFRRLRLCIYLLRTNIAQTSVFSALKQLVTSYTGSSECLPCSPCTFHSLVFVIADTLSRLPQPSLFSDLGNEKAIDPYTYLSRLLDDLSRGLLIPVVGKAWDEYCPTTAGRHSDLLARFCVTDALIKTLLSSSISKDDPYTEPIPSDTKVSNEHPRNIFILQTLLPRYLCEPMLDLRRIYTRILFDLAEFGADTFLNATECDIENPRSTSSLLLDVFQKELIPKKISGLFNQGISTDPEDPVFLSAKDNIVTMLLCSLSMVRLKVSPRKSSLEKTNQRTPLLPENIHGDVNALHDNFLFDRTSIYGSSEEEKESYSQRSAQGIIRDLVQGFWRHGFKEDMLLNIKAMLSDTVSDRVYMVYENLVFHVDPEMSDEVASKTIPDLFDHLLHTFPEPIPSLHHLLTQLSRYYARHFYRHVVSCVASDSEQKVARKMTLTFCLRRYMSGVDFWMQDPEMLNVLLVSDMHRPRENSERDDHHSTATWGTTTLGQCMVATEFMWAIKDLRDKQSDPERNMEDDEIAKKFLIELEGRLSAYIDAQENLGKIPLPLRVILCNIFLNLRFFCNTTHRPGWLSRAVEWAIQPVSAEASLSTDAKGALPVFDSSAGGETNHLAPSLPLHYLDDVMNMFERIHHVYQGVLTNLAFEHKSHAQLLSSGTIRSSTMERVDGLQRKYRQRTIAAQYPLSESEAQLLDYAKPSPSEDDDMDLHCLASQLCQQHRDGISKINQEPFGAVFSLLVAVQATLGPPEYINLAQPLWDRFLDDRNPHAFIPAAFLLLQCGEHVKETIVNITTHDFYSSDPLKRVMAIQKNAALSAYRLNVLSQEHIRVSSKSQPFRGDSLAFSNPFVPTDLGGNQFTVDEPRWMARLRSTSNFPIELRRQIEELGWQDDKQCKEHEAVKKLLTPLALLPSLYLQSDSERVMEAESDLPTRLIRSHHEKKDPNLTIVKTIQYRKRAATVHAWTSLYLSQVDIMFDNYGAASSAAREHLEHLLRDDHSVFLRAIFYFLDPHKIERTQEMLTRLKNLISMQPTLPPGFAYSLFNQLGGFIKWVTREHKMNGLEFLLTIHPVLSELVQSTHELSMRDFRKNKMEHLLVSTGQFWFTFENPPSIFPREEALRSTPFTHLDIPWDTFGVATLRISQIQFLTNFLRRYPREVYLVRKILLPFQPMPIPGRTRLDLTSESGYFPTVSHKDIHTACRRPSQHQEDATTLSTLRARTWLRFVDTLLISFNMNYNDRNEMNSLFMGVNEIFIDYHYDLGIVCQVLILYSRAVARFKRLFLSNRGYSLFIPAFFRVYCESHEQIEIRSAMEYTWLRFYDTHGEAFIFQMLGTLIPLILTAYTTSPEVGNTMTKHLVALMQTTHTMPINHGDTLGVKNQLDFDDKERAFYEQMDGDNNPMTIPFSNPAIRFPLMSTEDQSVSSNKKKFPMESYFKLFLTVIAYDPASLKAEQFVCMLGYMLPHFEPTDTMRSVIRDGVDALVGIFVKFSRNAKVPSHGPADTEAEEEGARDPTNPSSSQGPHKGTNGKPWQQNDQSSIKKAFVRLVEVYLHKGELNPRTHKKMSAIIRSILRDYEHATGWYSTDWLRDYLVAASKSIIDPKIHQAVLQDVLQDISHHHRPLMTTLDATELYHGLARIVEEQRDGSIGLQGVAITIRDQFVRYGREVALQHDHVLEETYSKFCHSLAHVMVAIMENTTVDMTQDLVAISSHSSLMHNVMIPLCFQFDMAHHRRRHLTNQLGPSDRTLMWMQLLSILLKASLQSSSSKLKSTPGALFSALASGIHHDEESSEASLTQTTALLFTLSLTALKVAIVRGEAYLNKHEQSWSILARSIRQVLLYGQQQKEHQRSASGRSTPSRSPPGRSPPQQTQALSSGNSMILYDFATWRFLEFTASFPSPLMMLLRDLIHDKLRSLGPRPGFMTASPRLSQSGPSLPSGPASPTGTQRSSRRPSWGPMGEMLEEEDRLSYSTDLGIQGMSSSGDMSPNTCGLGLSLPTQPSAGASNSGGTNMPSAPSTASTVMTLIHSETLSSVVHVQALMGVAPFLTWQMNHPSPLRRWTLRDATVHFKQEWGWLTRAYKEQYDHNLSTQPRAPSDLAPVQIPSLPTLP